MPIMRITVLTIFLAVFYMAQVSAEQPGPKSIVTDNLQWISPPQVPGLQFAWVEGSETHDGLYLLRVRLESGTTIPPHRHPDKRLSTVLSGTLYVGFGEIFDETALVAIESGNAYIAPAQMPHFILAKTGDVEYQETGLGPTSTEIIKNN